MSSPPSGGHPPPIAADGGSGSGGNDDNKFKPFFMLHSGEPKSRSSRNTKRRIVLSSPSPKSHEQADVGDNLDNEQFAKLRLEAFNAVWSKIECAITDSLLQINLNLFNEVHCWVEQSFLAMKPSIPLSSREIQRTYPLVTEAKCKQIPVAFILTNNVEFVDDLPTFQELGKHLKSKECHCVKLSALDLSVKHGIHGCLSSLLRHLVKEDPNHPDQVADAAVLASWYCEPENIGRPLIIIIENMEQCDGSVLSEFIIMLSEWTVKIPILFVVGTATVDAAKNLLKMDALKHLKSSKFTLGSPCERLNAIIETVLCNPYLGFTVSREVAVLLKNYFVRHEGTVTSFIRALKIACIKHFSMEPLSFLSQGMLYEDSETFWKEKCKLLPDWVFEYAFTFRSCQRTCKLDHPSRNEILEANCDTLIMRLSQLKTCHNRWSAVLMFLFGIGKLSKMQLLDIFCEAADPALYPSLCNSSDDLLRISPSVKINEHIGFLKGGCILQTMHKAMELPIPMLSQLIDNLSKNLGAIPEIHAEVKDLYSFFEASNHDNLLIGNSTDVQKLSSHRGPISHQENGNVFHTLSGIVRKCLRPIECTDFHEIMCFKNAKFLQTALVGDPRRIIQVDLFNPQTHLDCNCCSKCKGGLSRNMHDTSILHNLAQEYGDLVNLHDWYQAFKSTITSFANKPNSKAEASVRNHFPRESEAVIQSRFCRAVTELQITGLIRMPSKRRPDFVQRVALGL